jgi:hypothetical protein
VAFVLAIVVWLFTAEHMVFWQRAIGIAVISVAFLVLERTFKKNNNQ